MRPPRSFSRRPFATHAARCALRTHSSRAPDGPSTVDPQSLTAFSAPPSHSGSDAFTSSPNGILRAPPTSVTIQQMKYPTRGGRNLSERYRRLDRSLRGKEAYGSQISELSEHAQETKDGHRDTSFAKGKAKAGVNTFQGLVIPQEPRAPESDECCMSGCAICVYDLYSDALEDYKRAVNILRTTLTARNIPEVEWPTAIRRVPAKETGQMKENPTQLARNVTMDAFEALERSLREKSAAAQGAG